MKFKTIIIQLHLGFYKIIYRDKNNSCRFLYIWIFEVFKNVFCFWKEDISAFVIVSKCYPSNVEVLSGPEQKEQVFKAHLLSRIANIDLKSGLEFFNLAARALNQQRGTF